MSKIVTITCEDKRWVIALAYDENEGFNEVHIVNTRDQVCVVRPMAGVHIDPLTAMVYTERAQDGRAED